MTRSAVLMLGIFHNFTSQVLSLFVHVWKLSSSPSSSLTTTTHSLQFFGLVTCPGPINIRDVVCGVGLGFVPQTVDIM
jgi:hypothetical protein